MRHTLDHATAPGQGLRARFLKILKSKQPHRNTRALFRRDRDREGIPLGAFRRVQRDER